MGLEYKVEFSPRSPEELDQVLRKAPHFACYMPQYTAYEYRSPQNIHTMPDTVASIKEWGLYLCDYGNKEVFKDLLFYLFWYVNGLGQKFVIDDLE